MSAAPHAFAPRACVIALVAVVVLRSAAEGASQAGGGAVDAPALQALFADAVRKHQAGDLPAAAAAYRSFLVQQPHNVEAHSNLGALLAAQGAYEEAIHQYGEALAADPGRTAVRFNLAVALEKAGRPAEAAGGLERVVKEQPGHHKAIVLLAESRARLGEYGRAVELLTPLHDQSPDDRAVTYLLGLALVQSKQVSKGQALLDQILRDGASAETWLLLGAVKLQAGEYADARDDLRRSVDLNPKLPLANLNLGRALMNTGDVGAAADAFRAELEVNPNDFDSNLLLGVLLKQEQKLDEAMVRFKKAASVRPGDAAANYQIGALELNLGQTDEARQVLEEVIKAAPDFMEAHVSLATAYFRLKRKDDGNRHRAIASELSAKQQEAEPGAKAAGEAYRGEPVPMPAEQKEPPAP
jgi:predicted Zn-dependent protease